ncbi:MAG: O-antigen acetylase [Nitrospira sp.]|jgi:peptidoglycan/LPS O-acetylase OafA/YrhL|nr:O-antigen acetylase [Nitrospira sp.]
MLEGSKSHYPYQDEIGQVTTEEQPPKSDVEWSSPERSSAFRPDIEGLRGIAVLLVVLFHCGLSGFSGGFIGVDVFFVLSGFLITRLLVSEVQKTSTLSLLEFYARRVRRLLPAFALTLVATLLVGAILMTPLELNWTGSAGRAAALYVSNIFFDKNAGDYFSRDVQSNPLLHTWSLAVEEQFYLFWPLLILLTLRWGGSLQRLATVLFGLTLISLCIGVVSATYSGTFAFYELPGRAWEFGIGGLAALLPCGSRRIHSGWWLAFGWLGLLSILTVAHFLPLMGGTNFPGWIALIPTLGTAAVLIAGTEQPQRGVGTVLATAPLQTLGKLSYSWYLWHWPFLIFSAILLPTLSSTGKAAVATLALAVAGLSYHVVERPIRFHPFLLKRPALSVGLAGAVTICLIGAALLSMGLAAELAEDSRLKPIIAASHDLDRLPRTHECFPAMGSAEVKTCRYGDGSSGIHIVLFGDSHAIHWFNPLEQIAKVNGWKLTTMVKMACYAYDLRHTGEFAKYNTVCAQWRMEALKQIHELRPTLVFLANATGSLGQQGRDVPTSAFDQLRDGTRQTLQALAGLRVVVMRDTPYFPYNIPTCLARTARHAWYLHGSCEADRSTALNSAIFEAEQAGARGRPHVYFLDLTDLLCQRDKCTPMRGDTIIYRDDAHLTGNFAGQQMPALSLALDTIVHDPD